MAILNSLTSKGEWGRVPETCWGQRRFRGVFSLLVLPVVGLLSSSLAVAGETNLPVPAPAVAVSSPPAVAMYEYGGDRFRDPFVPLIGESTAGFEIPRPASEPLSPFNPAGAELKGIIKTSTGRWAILRTSDGVAYLVQNGKVFDPKRKAVEGFQGIVKEKTVVILGPKNQEVEVHLKKEDVDMKVPR